MCSTGTVYETELDQNPNLNNDLNLIQMLLTIRLRRVVYVEYRSVSNFIILANIQSINNSSK